MSFGFTVSNDTGTVVDGETSNLAFYGEITINRVTGPTYHTTDVYNLLGKTMPRYTHKSTKIALPSSLRPVITFLPPLMDISNDPYWVLYSKFITIEAVVYESDGWYVYCTCGPLLDSYTLKVFSPYQTTPFNDIYGIQVYNSSGNMTFNSGYKSSIFYGYQHFDWVNDTSSNSNLFSNSGQITANYYSNLYVSISGGVRAFYNTSNAAGFGQGIQMTIGTVAVNTGSALLIVTQWFPCTSTGYSSYSTAIDTILQWGLGVHFLPASVKRPITYIYTY